MGGALASACEHVFAQEPHALSRCRCLAAMKVMKAMRAMKAVKTMHKTMKSMKAPKAMKVTKPMHKAMTSMKAPKAMKVMKAPKAMQVQARYDDTYWKVVNNVFHLGGRSIEGAPKRLARRQDRYTWTHCLEQRIGRQMWVPRREPILDFHTCVCDDDDAMGPSD